MVADGRAGFFFMVFPGACPLVRWEGVVCLAGRLKPGDKLPFFRYDTPYETRLHFRDLLAGHAPLVLVFMSNFGHPVTRSFAQRYAKTFHRLYDGGFALVVRSHPAKLAQSLPEGTLPYPLLCDAEGVLYERFSIPQRSGALTSYSLEAWRILQQAKKQGYHPPKNTRQQLPLTLILDAGGTVLFSHYGASLTDVPEDCAAMQSLLEALDLVDPNAPPLGLEEGDPDAEVLAALFGTSRDG